MLCTIIGAGPGLGTAIAERFARERVDVALVRRSPQKLGAWLTSTDSPGRFRLEGADVTDERALGEAFERIRRWRGDPDVLIVNVADLTPDPVDALDLDTLAEHLRTDVGGALASVRLALPAMRRRGAGTILLTGGGLALEPYPEWASLAAGKAALRSIAINLHKALLPEGIHVAVVAVCGIVEPGGPFDPTAIAEEYWRLHAEPLDAARRELVYLPEGADPYYNDPEGDHRATSLPITPPAVGRA